MGEGVIFGWGLETEGGMQKPWGGFGVWRRYFRQCCCGCVGYLLAILQRYHQVALFLAIGKCFLE